MNLSPALEKKFNEQMNRELTNADGYFHVGSLADNLAWDGFAKYLLGEVDEERKHAEAFRKFIIDRNCMPKITAHPAQISEAKEPLEFVALVYGVEQVNTRELYALYQMCCAENDYEACEFLRPYLTIQRESERELFDLIQELKRCGSLAAVLIINERLLDK